MMEQVVAERTRKRSYRAVRGGSLVSRGECEDRGRRWNYISANTCSTSRRTSHWFIHTQEMDSSTLQTRPDNCLFA